jgi:hypothetical protein
MKRIVLFLVTLPALCVLSHAQSIVKVCGTETVTLRAGNFQYGTIQWERSPDNRQWEAIPGANDTTYTFMPEKDMYYRSVASFSECPQEMSETAFIQMPPRANAGFDRVSPGGEIQLMANRSAGAEGMWQVIEGTGGSLSDVNKPNMDSLYVSLLWLVSVDFREQIDRVKHPLCKRCLVVPFLQKLALRYVPPGMKPLAQHDI